MTIFECVHGSHCDSRAETRERFELRVIIVRETLMKTFREIVRKALISVSTLTFRTLLLILSLQIWTRVNDEFD